MRDSGLLAAQLDGQLMDVRLTKFSGENARIGESRSL